MGGPHDLTSMRYQLLFVLLFLTGATAMAQTKTFLDQPYIEVLGSADTAIIPDEIYIRITLSERDSRDRISLETQERKMTDGLRALGIDVEKDLTATDILSNYSTFFLRGKEVIKTKDYMLMVRTADQAGQVFKALEDANLSNAAIDHINYSQMETLRNWLRSKAIVSARERALALVRPLNQNLGPALLITDSEAQATATNSSVFSNARILIRGIRSIGFESDPGSKIDFEKIRISLSVQAKFALR